jgi:ABC-2 type transport system ATP-binding protein
VRTPDADAALALLDGRVERADGADLLVRHDDAAALNRLLVESGVRVELLAPERRTLEDVVLEATRAGSDRVAR